MKALVFVEKNTHTDKLRSVTAELTWKAHSLVKPLGGEVVGIFAGDKLPQDHGELFNYGGKILFQVRPAFGGNILATIITPFNRPMMATVREGVMLLPEEKVDKPVKLEEFKTEFKMEWIKNEFLEIIPKVSKVNFHAANMIVAGGAGVGCKENFRLLEQLAAVLGAEVGASRAAVDFGFAEKERQIGQTGSVVRPKLYIACGISGSIQHRAGMEESKKIIAINSDPNAPIFNIAHMGIVGDLKEIIPIMIKYLREE